MDQSTLLWAVALTIAGLPLSVSGHPITTTSRTTSHRVTRASGNSNNKNNEDSSMAATISGTAIAASAIAAGAFLLTLSFILFWFYKQRQTLRHSRRNKPNTNKPVPAPPVPRRARSHYYRDRKRDRKDDRRQPRRTKPTSTGVTHAGITAVRESRPMSKRLSWIRQKAEVVVCQGPQEQRVTSPLQRTTSAGSDSTTFSLEENNNKGIISRSTVISYAELPGSPELKIPQRATIRGFNRCLPPLPPLPRPIPTASFHESGKKAANMQPQLAPLKTIGTTGHPVLKTVSPSQESCSKRVSGRSLHQRHHLSSQRPQQQQQEQALIPSPDSTWSISTIGMGLLRESIVEQQPNPPDRFPVSPETPSTGGSGVVLFKDVSSRTPVTEIAATTRHHSSHVDSEGKQLTHAGTRMGSVWTIHEDSEWPAPPGYSSKPSDQPSGMI